MKIRTIATIQVAAGQRLGLTKAQADSRAHLLTEIGKGVYELTALAQFKAGEELDWHGEVPKHYASQIELLDKPAPARQKASAQPDSAP